MGWPVQLCRTIELCRVALQRRRGYWRSHHFLQRENDLPERLLALSAFQCTYGLPGRILEDGPENIFCPAGSNPPHGCLFSMDTTGEDQEL